MAKDFRTFLSEWAEKCPGEIVRVKKPVNPMYECSALIQNLEAQSKFAPLVIFENAVGLDGQRSPYPLVVNTAGSRKRLAVALGLSPEQYRIELSLAVARMEAEHKFGTCVVSRTDAPVKEVVKLGADASLSAFPICRYYQQDGGYYISGVPIITKNPVTNNYNTSILRCHVKDAQRFLWSAIPGRHSALIRDEYEKRGQPCPVVLVMGHHPAIYMGTQWHGTYGEDEYRDMAALLGEPLRLVESETWGRDFLVPADAEAIIEAEAVPGQIEKEGPFVEHFRYYRGISQMWPSGGQLQIKEKYAQAVQVKAVTHRKGAYFVPHEALGFSCSNLISAMEEGWIYSRLKLVAPGLVSVHCPDFGGGTHWTSLSLKQTYKGEARLALHAALGLDSHHKFVVAVDEDIDVFDDAQVLWAVTSRSNPAEYIIDKGRPGSGCDPITQGESLGEYTVTGLGIDATRPWGRPFCVVATVPEELKEKMQPEKWLEPM